MKKIIIFLIILFLSFEVSFAYSFDDSPHNVADNINSYFHDLKKYSFNSSDLIKDYKNESQYSVQILSGGEAVGAGECVTFHVNGLDYTRMTNGDGIAILNINLKPGHYIVYSQYRTFKNYNNILVI